MCDRLTFELNQIDRKPSNFTSVQLKLLLFSVHRVFVVLFVFQINSPIKFPFAGHSINSIWASNGSCCLNKLFNSAWAKVISSNLLNNLSPVQTDGIIHKQNHTKWCLIGTSKCTFNINQATLLRFVRDLAMLKTKTGNFMLFTWVSPVLSSSSSRH